jgi:formylglycine-generating enzyme required for sulfatase activity
LEGEELTDDQRDALCNMGESLGLTGGEAEDLIDEYLEEVADAVASKPLAPVKPPARAGAAPATMAAPAPQRAAPVSAVNAAANAMAAGAAARSRAAAATPAGVRAAAVSAPASSATATPPVPAVKPVMSATQMKEAAAAAKINTSPMARLQERQRFPNFTTKFGQEMMLVTSGQFSQGSDLPEAAPHEQPSVLTTVSCFFISRFPVTNIQYEQFDPSHTIRRPPWADDNHPVVYVSAIEAEKYCVWLTNRTGQKFRLPTEAEWEYAARGTDDRSYPWGERLDAGHYANFADRRTTFPWRDQNLDDGFAESAPVGSYPRGASPFGVEDMSGNVFEWCLDWFDMYRSTGRVNPRGPNHGTKRVYRGGSWKSRASSLRTSARAFNQADYSSNDVGFRIVGECDTE